MRLGQPRSNHNAKRLKSQFICASGALVAALAFATPAIAGFEDQPDNKYSTLPDNNGVAIRDSELAGWIKDILITDSGLSQVADAKFFFNQCYGGGFLDDISEAMGDTVKWVGGAASKHNETAIGQASEAENDAREAAGRQRYGDIWIADTPFSYWGGEMIEALGHDPLNVDKTVLESINEAIADDPTGQNQRGARGGQSAGQSGFGNGGDSIVLDDPSLTSHHAILFAGNPDAERHFNTIDGVYNQLKDRWGDPNTNDNISITVLFGDGMKNSKGDNLPTEWDAKAATKANLQSTIAALETFLSPTEQFLFYGYDHGGSGTTVVQPEDPAIAVTPGSVVEIPAPLVLLEGEVEGMSLTENNEPVLRLQYEWLGGSANSGIGDFIINDVSLFTPFNLVPGINTVDAPVPEALLSGLGDPFGPFENGLLGPAPPVGMPLHNSLALFNGSAFGLNILGLDFLTGGINDTPVFVLIPEPSTAAMLLLLGSVVVRRRRKRSV